MCITLKSLIWWVESRAAYLHVHLLLRVLLLTLIRMPELPVACLAMLGFCRLGFHRDPSSKEVQTPVLDSPAASGLILNWFYAFKYWSPSRTAFQTGRNPIHVNVANPSSSIRNPERRTTRRTGARTKRVCFSISRSLPTVSAEDLRPVLGSKVPKDAFRQDVSDATLPIQSAAEAGTRSLRL